MSSYSPRLVDEVEEDATAVGQTDRQLQISMKHARDDEEGTDRRAKAHRRSPDIRYWELMTCVSTSIAPNLPSNSH